MQRSQSLPADPIELRQKNFLFGKKKKKIQKLEKPLTSEEAEKLLTSWRETGFAEFNSWIQIAKAQISTEIQENNEGFGRKAKKMFCCNLTLTFDEDPNLVMVSAGFAKSKKDAKKMAVEKIVMELIKNGEIGRGLKNTDFSQGQNNLNGPNHQIFRAQKEAIDESVQKKVQKLTKKMQDSLKSGSFFEACESLSQIVTKKKPDWNEIAFIWSYALLKKDFSYVKAIIDLIQFKKVQPSMNASVLEGLKASEPVNKVKQETEEEKAKTELIKKYGNGRLQSDNPYEVLDTFNVKVNLPEIDTTKETKEITEEEANAEIVKEPLSVDLNKLFVADPAEGYSLGDLNNMLTQLSNNPNSFANPTATFTDPKLLNLGNAVELNKLLHQLTFQPISLNLFGQSIDPNNQNILGSLSLDLSNLINQVNNLSQYQGESVKTNPVDDFKTPSRSYTTEDSLSNRTPQIDLSTSREVKNPSINYLSFRLLNEFYDTLLYVGDLNFALSVAEILYARIRLDDEDFINSFACYYFANKKNMLMIEMIESMYMPMTRNRTKSSNGLCSVEGSIEKIGHKFAQEVLLFNPLEPQDQVENRVLRRTYTEGRDSHGQISEGEFVKLTLCSNSDMPYDYLSNGEDSIGYLNQGFFFGQQQQQHQQQQSNTVADPDSSTLTGYEMVACVREIQKDYKVKLFVLPTREQSEMLGFRGKTWKISKLTNRTTIDKTTEALETFCTQITMAQPLLQIILSPPICNNNYVQQLAESKVFFHNKQHKVCVTNLNESQHKALDCATSQLLTLIQGPPGTGKTTTAVEIVLEWLRLSPIPILACADSNVAVDRLYEEFKAAGIRCMRIGPGYDEKNDLKNEKSYAMYTALCNAKQYHDANSVRFGIIKKKISEAQVVCATCVGSTSEYLKGITFQRVILDEVTQANEMATLIPLVKGCQQLVLVGDHKQLPPTVLSTFAQSKGMTISLFERLVKQGVVPNLLNVQYRMHSSISQFPSYQFYNNMLENGTDDADRPMFEGFNWPNNSIRVAFVNVKGIEEVYSSSIQNSKEVEVVVEILVKLLPYNHISSIGIITPYDAQKKRMRNEVNLQAKKYPQLFGLTQEEADKINRYSVINDIDTVDGYQGMEREMIIFSAVRSNHSGSLGFLRDPRRLNVTLTRAKRGLIVVGDMSTLMHDQNWKEWIQWCKRNQVVLHYK